MIPEISIREAARADLAAVLALYAQPAFDAAALEESRALPIWERMKSYPDYRIYTACIGERIVGTFALLIMDNLGHLGTPSAIVEDVVVAAEFRGRGIGRGMMDFAMRTARTRGCYKLVLSSNLRRERAHRFYDSLGFERHGHSFRIDL